MSKEDSIEGLFRYISKDKDESTDRYDSYEDDDDDGDLIDSPEAVADMVEDAMSMGGYPAELAFKMVEYLAEMQKLKDLFEFTAETLNNLLERKDEE